MPLDRFAWGMFLGVWVGFCFGVATAADGTIAQAALVAGVLALPFQISVYALEIKRGTPLIET